MPGIFKAFQAKKKRGKALFCLLLKVFLNSWVFPTAFSAAGF